MLINSSAETNGGFAPSDDDVTVEVHYWDYIFSVLYGLIMLINVSGIVQYAFKAHILTLLIMVTNFFSIFCKSLMFEELSQKPNQ